MLIRETAKFLFETQASGSEVVAPLRQILARALLLLPLNKTPLKENKGI